MAPGDILIHRPWERHLDRIEDRGAEVLVLDLMDCDCAFLHGRTADPDEIARLAETDPDAALDRAIATSVAAPRASSDWPDLLAQAIRVDPELSLGDWAGRAHLHLGSLSRGFRQVFGVTPKAYRLAQRTLRAIEMVSSGAARLSAVAHDCRFADQAHMARAIRAATDGARAISDGDSTARGLRRVLVLGATGTIGRATVRALVARGYEVVCFVRRHSRPPLDGATLRFGDVTDPTSLAHDGFREECFDALVSCLASRTGAPADAWAIDYQAHVNALKAAKTAGVSHMVLLSAICVQKPRLAFQHAKLAFEKALVESGLTYSIVRPTAFFKSLSGQIGRATRGKPYLLFGNGERTACKPISDDDLASFIVDCLDDESRHNRILPIGGPGEAITPKQQGEAIFALVGRAPRFRQVPIRLLDVIISTLTALGRVFPALANKAELARIGRYYATESMLVLDPATGRYDAGATPATGSETLFDFYAQVVRGETSVDRGDHAVF